MRTSLRAEPSQVAQMVIHTFIFHILATYSASTPEIPAPELVALSAKLPVNNVSPMPDSERMTADKGKGVTRSRGDSEPTEDRGRSLNAQDTSDNDNDPDAAISGPRLTPTSPHASPAPVRRSSRRRAMSRSRVPHTVSELNAQTSSSVKKANRKVTLDVTPSPETIDTEPSPSPEASSSAHQCETSTTCECPSAQEEVKFVYKRAIEGGVKCIRGPNGTWVLLIPPDHDRELQPGRKVMNAKSSILWLGPHLMPYIFWAHIPEDKRLDRLQPSVRLTHTLDTRGN